MSRGRLDAMLRCPDCGTAAAGCRHGDTRWHGLRDLRPADRRVADSAATSAECRAYDAGVQWLAAALGTDETHERARLTARLRLVPGAAVLDIGCGTGSAFPSLAGAVGPPGSVVGLDVSVTMLELAVQKLADRPLAADVELLLGDAQALPFADGAFDAALHVGSINAFEPRSAIAEAARVVRRGGRVVLCDEGLAPWLRETDYGRRLLAMSPPFAAVPPLAALPANAEDAELSWVLGDAFWVIAFTVGTPRTATRALPAAP